MQIRFLPVVIVFVISGCTSNFNGKVEARGNSYYLVNTSPTHAFRFTVKKTEVKDDSLTQYSTELIELQPGEEELLGNKIEHRQEEELDSTSMSKSIEIFQPSEEQLKASEKSAKKRLISKHEASGDQIDPSVLDQAMKNEFDTVINGRPMMYRYVDKSGGKSTNTSTHKLKFNFQITGQVPLKE